MTTALFETEVGSINIEFFSEDAPNTVKNFTKLISDGFYDGLAFHLFIPISKRNHSLEITTN